MGLILFSCRFSGCMDGIPGPGFGDYWHFNPVTKNSVTIGFLIM